MARAAQVVRLAGTPDAVIQQIIDFQAVTGVGVLDLIFAGANTPPPVIRHAIDLFGREVLPNMKKIGAALSSSFEKLGSGLSRSGTNDTQLLMQT